MLRARTPESSPRADKRAGVGVYGGLVSACGGHLKLLGMLLEQSEDHLGSGSGVQDLSSALEESLAALLTCRCPRTGGPFRSSDAGTDNHRDSCFVDMGPAGVQGLRGEQSVQFKVVDDSKDHHLPVNAEAPPISVELVTGGSVSKPNSKAHSSALEAPSSKSNHHLTSSKEFGESSTAKTPATWREISREMNELRRGQRLALEEPSEEPPGLFLILQAIVQNWFFEVSWAMLVILSTVVLISEEEYTGMQDGARLGVYEYYGSEQFRQKWWPSAPKIFYTVDCVLAALFTLEIVLTYTYDIWNLKLGLVCTFRTPFWKHPMEIVDLVVVVANNMALFVGSEGPMSNVRLFRILRLMKPLRLIGLLRRFHSLDPLHLMTTAIKGSVGALLWSLVLLCLILTLFATLVSHVLRFTYLNEDSPLTGEVKAQLFRYFGTYTRSMLSMFELTLANWPTICRFLVDEVHEMFGVFCLGFKLSVGFAVIGVINGVFIQETFHVALHDDFIMVRKKMKQVKHDTQLITRLFQLADQDGDGMVDKHELGSLLENQAVRMWVEAMELNCADIDMLYELVSGGRPAVTIDEFINGIGRLKGPARNIDMLSVLDILQRHFKESQLSNQKAFNDALETAALRMSRASSMRSSCEGSPPRSQAKVWSRDVDHL